MRITAFPNPSAAKYWRMVDPLSFLATQGAQVRIAEGPINEQTLEGSDIVILHNCVDKQGIALIGQYQQAGRLKLVVEQDDWIDVEQNNPFKIYHDLRNAGDVVRGVLAQADLVTTTTDALAKKLSAYNRTVAVLPNAMNLARWDLSPKLKNDSGTIRIGWAGSITHLEDLQLALPALRQLCAEFAQLRLIFLGDYRIHTFVDDLPAEVLPGVPFDAYPMRLRSLRLDIAIAPLRDTPFNRCKSNIKYQEYSINQIPGVYSPTVYSMRGFEPTFGLIARNDRQWYQCLKNLIVSKNLREDISRHAYAFVRSKYNLAKTARHWHSAYQQLLT